MGAVYQVRTGADLNIDHGSLSVTAGVQHNKLQEVIQAITKEFKNLKEKPVPEKELQHAKDHLIGTLAVNLETSDQLAGFCGEQEITTGQILLPENVTEKIQAVTAEEVQKLASDIFQNNKLNLAVIGPVADKDVLQEVLKIDQNKASAERLY